TKLHGICRGGKRWTKTRLDAGAELARAERLGDVVVGAEFQAQHLLAFVSLSREQDDGSADPAPPELTANIEAVNGPEHHIQQDQVEPAGGAELQAEFAIAGDLCLVPMARQILGESVRHIRLVFDNENSRHLTLCPAA